MVFEYVCVTGRIVAKPFEIGCDAPDQGGTMSKQFKSPVMIMCFFVTSIAAAHPGHAAGGGDSGVLHYLSHPLHVVVGVSLAAALLTAIAWARHNRPRSRRVFHRK